MEQQTNSFDSLTDAHAIVGPVSDMSAEKLFHRCMVDNLREGVVFVDRHLNVTLWNCAAEELTGLRGTGMINNRWTPSQIGLKDRHDKSIADCDCPVAHAIEHAERKLIAATVSGRGGRQVAIDLQVVPVIAHDESIFGAAIFLHDLSSQVDLEQQVLTLYAHATRDQLTGVSNRAHFERSLDARLKEFKAKDGHCSLIITDIDFFKRINDEFGHHVGDHALMSFAKLLQKSIRAEDLVARYGGEEFVIVCPDCKIDDAVHRAEEIRQSLEQTPMSVLNGQCLSASFGVTEFHADDSATTVFVRADQALLNAKENGRNQVQSLQNDRENKGASTTSDQRGNELAWKPVKGHVVKCVECETKSPIGVLVEKIKGFVFDADATITHAEPNYIRVRVDKTPGLELKRFTDRHTPLQVDIEVKDEVVPRRATSDGSTCTRIRVTVSLIKARDRRHRELGRRVERLLAELRSHLGVTFQGQETSEQDSR